MNPNRLNSFTDGVIAIIITIMVLELPVPKAPGMAALKPELTLFGAYALSFIKVGIYWFQHHHLLQASKRVDGRVLLANLFFLFWLSLVPFVVRWVGDAGITPRHGDRLRRDHAAVRLVGRIAEIGAAGGQFRGRTDREAGRRGTKGAADDCRLRRLDWHRASLAARRRSDLLRRCGDVARPRQEVRATHGLT